jgi:hypothetical protein
MTYSSLSHVCFQLASVALALALSACAHAKAAENPELPLTEETNIVLASVEEGGKVLATNDEFTRSLSKFDLQARMQRTENATLDDWKKFVKGEVLPWSDEDIAHVKPAVTMLAEKLKKFKLRLPEKVLLVHTSGKEEWDAAYTRANAMMLPSRVLTYAPERLEDLLCHELFHVLSRHDAETRQRLYGIIGFRACEKIDLPAALKDRKITNPDAPEINCTIDLKLEGRVAMATPVLYSKVEKYDPAKAEKDLKYNFRLMVVEEKNGKRQPMIGSSGPILLDPRGVASYLEQIGRNTEYIIHPDEVLADNFIKLVKEAKNLPSPKIVEQMQSVLKP